MLEHPKVTLLNTITSSRLYRVDIALLDNVPVVVKSLNTKIYKMYQKHVRVFVDFEKEYKILQRANKAGCRIAKPICYTNTSIVYQLIGDNMCPAQKISQADPDLLDWSALLFDVQKQLTILLECDIAHNDVCGENMLIHKGNLYLIDFSNASYMDDPDYDAILFGKDILRIILLFKRHTSTHVFFRNMKELFQKTTSKQAIFPENLLSRVYAKTPIRYS